MSVLPVSEMGIDGDQPIMKGDGLGLRGKILEVVHASGAEMPENGPVVRVLRFAIPEALHLRAKVSEMLGS